MGPLTTSTDEVLYILCVAHAVRFNTTCRSARCVLLLTVITISAGVRDFFYQQVLYLFPNFEWA